MAESTHRVEVVRIPAPLPHPNADTLAIVRLGGFRVIVKASEWKEGDLAAYVQPDTLVPLDREEFSWLAASGRTPYVAEGRQYHLVRTVRLRKEPSMGLLLHAPADAVEGQDLADYYGAKHYEPVGRTERTANNPRHGRGSDAEPKPTVNPPVYDLENLRRYADTFFPGERVTITEKIHGANARYTAEDRGLFSFSWRNGSIALRVGSKVFTWGRGRGFKVRTLESYARFMRCGSRTQWRKPDPNDAWWRGLADCPALAQFCQNRPGWTVYGEIYGDVQDLDYGLKAGEIKFVAFDMRLPDGSWASDAYFRTLCDRYGITRVPVLYDGPFDLDKACELAEGKTVLGNGAHVREGVVVVNHAEPRSKLKVVGNGYYERKVS